MSNIQHSFQTIIDSHDNTKVVLVPLAKGRGHAKVNEEDFLTLLTDGYRGRWFLNSNMRGNEYVRLFHGTNNKSVANLIMGSPRGHVVSYVNRDHLDLRRKNLTLCTRREAREKAHA